MASIGETDAIIAASVGVAELRPPRHSFSVRRSARSTKIFIQRAQERPLHQDLHSACVGALPVTELVLHPDEWPENFNLFHCSNHDIQE